jgi:hypothetical protein
VTDWRVSSHTNGSGSCVQLRSNGETWFVRDSKDRRDDPPTLTVPAAGWAALLVTTRMAQPN